MRITVYQTGEVYAPDRLLGYVGETNHREIEYVYDDVTGATNYEMRLLYPDGTSYLAPITNKKVTVTGSMLPAAGRIHGQWLAYAVDENEEFTLVAKSEMFELIIGASIGDDVEPVPTYEATLSVVQQLIETGMTKEQIITAIQQIVETGEVEDLDSGFVTTLKEKNHGIGLSVWVGTNAEYQQVSPKEENTLYIRTDVDDLTTITNSISTLSSDLSTLSGTVSGLSTTVSGHTTSISALQTATADGGWTSLTLYAGWDGTAKIRKIGSLVELKINVEYLSGTNPQICGIPTGFRPSEDVYDLLPTDSSSNFASMSIRTTGNYLMVSRDPATLSGLTIKGSIVYMVG